MFSFLSLLFSNCNELIIVWEAFELLGAEEEEDDDVFGSISSSESSSPLDTTVNPSWILIAAVELVEEEEDDSVSGFESSSSLA